MSPPSNPTTSDLIFPSQAHNFSTVLSQLKRSKHSISQRLASIDADAQVVQAAAQATGLPVVANERCGSWYVPPELKAGSVYFKSTDGHHGQWGFSTRRLNLHLIGLVEEGRGCIIVDSTRRGKTMPDALSKTIPIWIAVLNRALFPEYPETHDFPTPPAQTKSKSDSTSSSHSSLPFPPSLLHPPVSQSEANQITTLLPSFHTSLHSLNLTMHPLSAPLLPIFLTPSTLPLLPADLSSFLALANPPRIPIILLTASRTEPGDADSGYIQGAADDTEMWARGLEPDMFWGAREELLLAGAEEDVRERVRGVVREWKGKRGGGEYVDVGLAGRVWVGIQTAEGGEDGDWDGIVFCGGGAGDGKIEKRDGEDGDGEKEKRVDDDEKGDEQHRRDTKPPSHPPQVAKLYLNLLPGKPGSRTLRSKLLQLHAFMAQAHQHSCSRAQSNKHPLSPSEDQRQHSLKEHSYPTHPTAPKILILCPTAKDHSIGIALALSCLYFDSEGEFRPSSLPEELNNRPNSTEATDLGREHGAEKEHGSNKELGPEEKLNLDKAVIRQRLVRILARVPGANPARATLNSVNSFLMGRGEGV